MKNEINTQHTPGPWKASELDENTVQIRLDRNYTHECINIADVHVMTGNLGETVPEAIANAKLIARAPELLKENEQLTEKLNGFKKAHYDMSVDLDNTKAINAELLDSLRYLRENTRSINPEHWQPRTADALTFAEKMLSKAEAKNLGGS